MKKILWTMLFSALGSVQGAAQEIVPVGKCPHQISIQREGLWKFSTESPEAIANLRANPARKTVVVTVFVRPEDGSYFNILGLGSLDPFQGRISEADFAQIKSAYSKASPSGPAGLRARVENLVVGSVSGNALESYDFSSRFDDRIGQFAVYGETTISSKGKSEKFITAQRTDYIKGCVITINFGFPADAYDLDKVTSAIWEVKIQ